MSNITRPHAIVAQNYKIGQQYAAGVPSNVPYLVITKSQDGIGHRLSSYQTVGDVPQQLVAEVHARLDPDSGFRAVTFPLPTNRTDGVSLYQLQSWRNHWGEITFKFSHITKVEHAFRFLEESIELAQALGLTEQEVNRQTQIVYERPAGTPAQEMAGTLVTLLALASENGIDLEEVVVTELNRINHHDLATKIADRQAEKRANGLTRGPEA